MMNYYDDRRIRFSFLYSFIIHILLIWILSFFIMSKPISERKYISVSFMKGEYLPQPLKVGHIKKKSKILGIPESSVVLSDLQFKEIDEVHIPESQSFAHELSDPVLYSKDKIKKIFKLGTENDSPGKGNPEIKRSDSDLFYPDIIDDADFEIGDSTGSEDSLIRITGKDLQKRRIIHRPTIPKGIKLKENVQVALDFEVTPEGNAVNISPVIIADQKLTEISISLIQQFRWEAVKEPGNVKGKAVIIFKMK